MAPRPTGSRSGSGWGSGWTTLHGSVTLRGVSGRRMAAKAR
jgi:hypothetical protein